MQLSSRESANGYHLGAQFDIEAPDLASLRTMYRRRRTLFEHQDLGCAVLGFHTLFPPTAPAETNS